MFQQSYISVIVIIVLDYVIKLNTNVLFNNSFSLGKNVKKSNKYYLLHYSGELKNLVI